MKQKLRKIILNKQIILSLLVAIVVLTGIVNWANIPQKSSEPVSGPADFQEETPIPSPLDFFAQTIKDRDISRSKTLEILEQNNQQEEIKNQTAFIQTELNIESQLKSKGFEKAICYVSSDSCSLVIKHKNLTASDVSIIKDIIIANTKLKANQIKISEHE